MKIKKYQNSLFLFLGIFSIFIVWIILSVMINNNLIIPKISLVIVKLKEILVLKESYISIFNTIFRLLLVVIIAFILALVLSILSYISKKIEVFLKPLFTILRTIPVIAIIILLLIIFGNKSSPSIMTLMVILPVMYEGFLISFKKIAADVIDDVKTISKINFVVIKDIYVKISLPYIITAIIQSFGLGLKVMVMGEFIAQPPKTIGYQMVYSRLAIDQATILAWTIILIVIVLIVDLLVQRFSTKHE